jgi:hypothetical protein
LPFAGPIGIKPMAENLGWIISKNKFLGYPKDTHQVPWEK